MAGAGFKTFATGDVLTASDVNTYLMQQTVMVFANSTARSTALGANVAQGMLSYLTSDNTIYAYNGSTWVAAGSSGDITGVTAGTGLSGGGTSGDVTVSLSTPVAATNGGTGASTFTTGDILYSSATNTLSKLGIGSTGQVLTVAAGVPSWAAASGGSAYSGASLYQSSDINISNTTSTTLTWDSEQWDTDSYHSTSSNTSRITIPSGKAGKFKFNIQIRYPGNSTGRRIIYLYKNGSELWSSENTPGSQNMVLAINTQADAAVGDYFEVKTYQSSGGTLAVTEGSTYSFFQVSYLGA